MLHLKLLRYYVLVSVVVRAGSIQAEAGESIEPPSLEEQFCKHVEAIIDKPLMRRIGSQVGYHADQELVQGLEAVLRLISDRLADFVKDYSVYKPKLQLLNSKHLPLDCEMRANRYEDMRANQYDEFLQDPGFLYRLGITYRWALKEIDSLLEVWSEDSLGSLDALATFLSTGVEALRVECELRVYTEIIFGQNCNFLRHDQNDAIAEKFKSIIYVRYETLAERKTELFGRMINEQLESILSVLESSQRIKVCKRLRCYLYPSFHQSMRELSPSEMEKSDEMVFKSGDQRMPPEVLATMWVLMFRELLEFELKFPELEHQVYAIRSYYMSHTCDHFDGPPLITEGAMMLKKFERIDAPTDSVSNESPGWDSKVYMLRAWLWQLYLKLLENRLESHAQAEEWLREMEENLCKMLEVIEADDRQVRLYTLGCLIADLEPLAVAVEKVLKGLSCVKEGMELSLCQTMELGREERGPGYFLTKLRWVIGRVLREGAGVKNARMTRGPEGS